MPVAVQRAIVRTFAAGWQPSVAHLQAIRDARTAVADAAKTRRAPRRRQAGASAGT